MHLQDVADNIVDYLSEDARFSWPCRRGLSSDVPSSVWFVFETKGGYVGALLARFAVVLRAPFTFREEGKEGAPILLADHECDADAVICFSAERREGDRGLAYRIVFPRHEEVFTGWFSLCEEA